MSTVINLLEAALLAFLLGAALALVLNLILSL